MTPEKARQYFEALNVGVSMRQTQKEYFKTRDRAILERSKALEREFDKLAEQALKPADLLG